MNRTDLIDGLEARLGDRKVATAALDGFLDIVNRAVAKGEKVSISGFGTFEKVNRPARKARNPQTGEQVRVKKTAVPKFRPGTGFKNVANGTTKLGREPKHEPLLPSGVTRIVANAMKEDSAMAPAPRATRSRSSVATAAKAAPAKKTTARKTTAAKTTTTKSAATKSAATKSTSARSTAAKATAAKETPAKTTARKTTARKTTETKATPAKASSRTTSARATKAAPAKTTAKRTTTRKTAAKKVAAAS